METHCKFVCMALEAGKHVFVEKPVGATMGEITAMKLCAAKKQRILMPGHNYVYEDALHRMKDMIDNGSIGRVTNIFVMYNIHHPESVAARYPGVIRQIMTHHAYVTLYLAGAACPPETVSAMKSTINDGSVSQENLAVLMVKMKGGAVSVLQTSFANDDHGSDPWSFYIKVLGTEGSCRYSYNDFVDSRKHIVHSHTYTAYPYTVANISKFFIQECILKEKAPLSTIDDAAMALRMLEAADRSITEGIHVNL